MNAMPQTKPGGQVSLLEWKPLPRNSLRGFATVRYGSLKISDVSVHCSSGKRWANLPSKPQMKDSAQIIGPDGKGKWVPILEWSSKEAADRFSEAVVEAVEREHPGDTEA